MEEPSQETSEVVKAFLSEMRVEELRSLAEERGIDIAGLGAKEDLVDVIALYPGIAKIVGLDQEIREGEEVGLPVLEEEAEEAPGEEAEEAAPLPTHSEKLQQALKATVDFSALEDFLSETATQFKDRSYDAATQAAKDSVFKVEEKVREYVGAGWAFGIVSAQRILETSNPASEAAEEANKRLQEAMDAFQDDSFLGAPGLLETLNAATLTLYAHEMKEAREHVEIQERALEEIQAMGGDIAPAATMLGRAREVLDENHRASYLDLIIETDRLVSRAKRERIEEIKESADSIETVIEEARSIGSDVKEASELMDDVRRAIEASEFVSAHDLVSKAERTALESQKAHMDRVAEMREKKVEKVKELIGAIKPLIGKAKAEGLQADKAMGDLKAAAEHVKAGDYVNGLIVAKQAYRAAKSFRSQMEARRLEAAPEETKKTLQVGKKGPAAEESSKAVPACVQCGSLNIEVGMRGKARCVDCGTKFRVTP